MVRAAFKPTPELRQKVRQLAIVGLPQDDIAKLVECSPKTLRKHFRRELDQGVAEANAMIAGYLFQSAKAGNVAAQIFWLKTRARWKEGMPQAMAEGETPPDSEPSDAKILENLKSRILNAQRDDDGEQKT